MEEKNKSLPLENNTEQLEENDALTGQSTSAVQNEEAPVKEDEKKTSGGDAIAALGRLPFVRAWREKHEERKRRDPVERVNKMNSYFDRIITPLIIIALLLFLIFGVFPKISCASCGAVVEDKPNVSEADSSFAARRRVLLESFSSYKPILENAGFLYDEESDYAFISYEDGIDIIEHYTDTSGNICTLIMNSAITDSEDDMLSIMYYSDEAMLALLNIGDSSYSAVFDNAEFEPDLSDSDATTLLGVVKAETLRTMLERYKECINGLIE